MDGWLLDAARRRNGIELQVLLGTLLVLIALALMISGLMHPLFSHDNIILLGLSAVVNLLGAPLFSGGLEERQRLIDEVRAHGVSEAELKSTAWSLLRFRQRIGS